MVYNLQEQEAKEPWNTHGAHGKRWSGEYFNSSITPALALTRIFYNINDDTHRALSTVPYLQFEDISESKRKAKHDVCDFMIKFSEISSKTGAEFVSQLITLYDEEVSLVTYTFTLFTLLLLIYFYTT